MKKRIFLSFLAVIIFVLSSCIPAKKPAEDHTPSEPECVTVWLVEKETAPTGKITEYTYNEHGQEVQAVTRGEYGEIVSTVTSEYDENLNCVRKTMVTSTYPQGLVTEYVYDASGRVTEEKYPLNPKKFVYDAEGRQIEQTTFYEGTENKSYCEQTVYSEDGSFVRTRTQHKKNGEVSSVETSRFDKNGRLIDRVTENRSQNTKKTLTGKHVLDDALRVLSSEGVREDGVIEWRYEYTYTEDGRVESVVDSYATGARNTTAYSYDKNGNLTTINYFSFSGQVSSRTYTYMEVKVPLADAAKITAPATYAELP